MYFSFLPTEYIKSRIDSQQRINDPLFSFPTEVTADGIYMTTQG